MADSLPTWREPEAVLAWRGWRVAERAGSRREDIAARLAPLHRGDRVVFFDMPRIDICPRAIRGRVAAGARRYLVPDAVADGIAVARPLPCAAGRHASMTH